MFKIKIKFLGAVLCFLRKGNRIRPEDINIKSVKTLVVINNKRLGDLLFCTPALAALKKANQEMKIVIVTSKANAGLVTGSPHFDDVMYLDESIRDAVRIGSALAKLKPDIGIIFHSKTPYDLIALTISRSSCILKHYFGNETKVLFNVCDGYVIGGTKPPVQNDLDLIKKLGVHDSAPEMFFPLSLPAKVCEKVSIGLQLGASGDDRFLPINTAAKVIYDVGCKYPDAVFHLIGTAKERELGFSLLASISADLQSRIINHQGETTIAELGQVINNLTLLITPDTGSLHIATALKTRTVSLFLKRAPNMSIPQQDTDKHYVVYASDYGESDSINSGSKLSVIPGNVVISAVLDNLERAKSVNPVYL